MLLLFVIKLKNLVLTKVQTNQNIMVLKTVQSYRWCRVADSAELQVVWRCRWCGVASVEQVPWHR